MEFCVALSHNTASISRGRGRDKRARDPLLHSLELLGRCRARGDAGPRQDDRCGLHRRRPRQADRCADPRRSSSRFRIPAASCSWACWHRSARAGCVRNGSRPTWRWRVGILVDRARLVDAVDTARSPRTCHGRARCRGAPGWTDAWSRPRHGSVIASAPRTTTQHVHGAERCGTATAGAPAHAHRLDLVTENRPKAARAAGAWHRGRAAARPGGARAAAGRACRAARSCSDLMTVVVFSLGFAATLVVVGIIAAKVGRESAAMAQQHLDGARADPDHAAHPRHGRRPDHQGCLSKLALLARARAARSPAYLSGSLAHSGPAACRHSR